MRTPIYFLKIGLALSFVVLINISIAHAQLILPTGTTPFTFILDPEHPRPHENVNISIENFSIDLRNSYIEWYQSGERIDAGIGKTDTMAQTGTFGENRIVSVIIETPDGRQIRDEILLRPVAVSLLWEADTYTPPFFRGRALPVQGSSIRAEAKVEFVRANGVRVENNNLVFTWKVDGRTLSSISGQGKSTALIETSPFFGGHTLSVEVVSVDNEFNGSAVARIPSAEPYIALYRDDPLLGITFHDAIGSEEVLVDSETTVAAIPYYTNITNPLDDALSYTWRIGGREVSEDPLDPFRLILQITEEIGGAIPISLSISHNEHTLQTAKRQWLLSQSERTAPQRDPFQRPVR